MRLGIGLAALCPSVAAAGPVQAYRLEAVREIFDDLVQMYGLAS